MMRYFVGFMITIGLIIILILLLFSGGGSSKKPKTPKSLASYASTNAQVRLTIDGPINANQIHNQAQISVNQYDITYNQIQGYEGNVVASQSFDNNQNAYSDFLYALGHAGFTMGDSNKLLANEKGYCPLGDRYIFELIDNGQDIQRYWATNCGSPKTYKGRLTLTLSLFEAQVPGYTSLSQKLAL